MNIDITNHQKYRIKLDTIKSNKLTHEFMMEYKEKIQSMRINIQELKNQTELYEYELTLQQKTYKKLWARYLYHRKKIYWATQVEKKDRDLNLSFD